MKTSKPLTLMICAGVICTLLAISFRILFNLSGSDLYLTLYVTALTFSYHFLMRLAVGALIQVLYRNKAFSYDSPWFRQHPLEKKLYDLVKIKRWKLSLVTARPEQFDLRTRTYDELLHNMTQAEVVHEIIMVLSFVPLLLIPRYGAASVFVLTSLAACLIDSLFVMIQRYNRPRILRLKKRAEHSAKRRRSDLT